MAYTALQFITRGRENGITMVELSIFTGYNSQTAFYLIKVLAELGLVYASIFAVPCESYSAKSL